MTQRSLNWIRLQAMEDQNTAKTMRSEKFLVSYGAFKVASLSSRCWGGGDGGGVGGCRLRPRATSHRRCSRAAMAAASARLREGLAETRRRKMYVKITCLQDALYKPINLSVFTTVHRKYKRCAWRREILFPVGFIVGFTSEWCLLPILYASM